MQKRGIPRPKLRLNIMNINKIFCLYGKCVLSFESNKMKRDIKDLSSEQLREMATGYDMSYGGTSREVSSLSTSLLYRKTKTYMKPGTSSPVSIFSKYKGEGHWMIPQFEAHIADSGVFKSCKTLKEVNTYLSKTQDKLLSAGHAFLTTAPRSTLIKGTATEIEFISGTPVNNIFLSGAIPGIMYIAKRYHDIPYNFWDMKNPDNRFYVGVTMPLIAASIIFKFAGNAVTEYRVDVEDDDGEWDTDPGSVKPAESKWLVVDKATPFTVSEEDIMTAKNNVVRANKIRSDIGLEVFDKVLTENAKLMYAQEWVWNLQHYTPYLIYDLIDMDKKPTGKFVAAPSKRIVKEDYSWEGGLQ